jgi:hypothetical protein
LVLGEDLMCFEIGEVVSVRRHPDAIKALGIGSIAELR